MLLLTGHKKTIIDNYRLQFPSQAFRRRLITRLQSLGTILIGLYLQRLKNVCLRKSFRILAPTDNVHVGHHGLSGFSPSLALSSFASLISSSSLLIPVLSLSFSFLLSDFSVFFDFFDDFSGDFDRDFDLDR